MTFKTIRQLSARIEELTARPFGEILDAHQLVYSGSDSKDGRIADRQKTKSLAADIVNAALDLKKDSRPDADLIMFNLEVKTVPISPGLKSTERYEPLEDTKVCTLNAIEVVDETWHQSHVYRKLRSILFVPVVKRDLWQPRDWHVMRPFQWLMSRPQEQILSKDYDAVRALLLRGDFDKLSSSKGGICTTLLPRTGGKNREDEVAAMKKRFGVAFKRRNWFLSSAMVTQILRDNLAYQPPPHQGDVRSPPP